MSVQLRDKGECSNAADLCQSFETLHLRVSGISMQPTLRPGDVLTIHRRVFDQVESGQLVLYSRGACLFVHRVVRKLSGCDPALIARGDCMAENDIPVCPPQVLGTVMQIRRNGSYIVPDRTLRLMQRMHAWLLCRWGLFRRVVLQRDAGGNDPASTIDFRLIECDGVNPSLDSGVTFDRLPEILTG